MLEKMNHTVCVCVCVCVCTHVHVCAHTAIPLRMTLGLRSKADENSFLLGYYTVSSCNFLSTKTSR